MADFEVQERLPAEIALANPKVTIWTTGIWESWWEVECSALAVSKTKALITVKYSGLHSATWFWKERSGRVIDEVSELLQHEQGHFDIVELGRRRWQTRADLANQALIELATQGELNLQLSESVSRDQAAMSEIGRELVERLADQGKFESVISELGRSKWIDAGWAEGITELYDIQTDFGTKDRAQQDWTKRIREMLGEEMLPAPGQ